MVNRRIFLQKAIYTSLGFPLVHSLDSYSLVPYSMPVSAITKTQSHPVDYQYIVSRKIKAWAAPTPEGKRVPFKWPVFSLPASTEAQTVTLKFNSVPASSTQLLFRLTVALDIREEKLIEVFLPQSGRILGTLDIKYAYALQPFELPLPVTEITAIRKEGIGLRMIKGEQPAWFFTKRKNKGLATEGLQPHLLVASVNKSLSAFYSNLYSLNSIQPFGWMEGCVMDGLYDLWQATSNKQAMNALKGHIDLFFTREKQLVYEDPRSKPADGRIYGIEGTLPFAVIAKLDPGHPSVALMKTYYVSRKAAGSTLQDEHLTTEGCYTIAYPLAVSATRFADKELALLALAQLQKRQQKLTSADAIYQRIDRDGNRSFQNWGRGVTWYLLGMIRTLIALRQHPDYATFKEIASLEEEFKRAAHWALGFRNSEGLWYAYINLPETGVDTSASAGIAAAIALGIKFGYLLGQPTEVLQPTLQALAQYLSPDGFLRGVCQSNRGGEALQRNGYRVISQYASGLMAQLIAALPVEQ